VKSNSGWRTTILDWIDSIISALYGKNYSADRSRDAEFVSWIREFVEPMWGIILNRFDGTPRSEPLIVPVDSPAGSPTTFADKGTEVLVFDKHLMQLIIALTIMSSTKVNAEVFVPAIASMYAERAFSAGQIETATLIGAGSRLAVASSPSIVIPEKGYSWIQSMCITQLAFVVAHELAHLAFSEYPDRVAQNADEHRQLLQRAISVSHSDTVVPPDHMEHMQVRMEQLGYSPSARARYFSKIQETEQPVSALTAWDLLSGDKEFMIEVMADHMACVALLRSHRIDFAPEFLATAAAFAVYNLSVLQYMDQLTSGHPPDSLAREPEANYWQALARGMAVRESLNILAIFYEREGEPQYEEGSLVRISKATGDVHNRTLEYIIDPLLWSADFGALERTFLADQTTTLIARGVSRTPDDVRRFLGFGSATDKAIFTKYLNITVLGDEAEEGPNLTS
jgi:hypothetical protein